jgi:hypothetical protein
MPRSGHPVGTWLDAAWQFTQDIRIKYPRDKAPAVAELIAESMQDQRSVTGAKLRVCRWTHLVQKD